MDLENKPVLGIDLGSISLNLALIDKNCKILERSYIRTGGQPLKTLLKVLKDLSPLFDSFSNISVTGSGRNVIGKLFSCSTVNEILAHAKGAFYLNPQVRTIIEIGGQDSKLILLDYSPETGEVVISDNIMNDVCAAGTGSFLDQQAGRLGLTIEEFSSIALKSQNPAPIAGRCSVFAKSDMIHLQQEGVPQEDIVSGLCFALARGFLANLARGRDLPGPIQFQGGVAANAGVRRAFEKLLNLPENGLIVPEHFMIMGAYGAAIYALKEESEEKFLLSNLISLLEKALVHMESSHDTSLKPLSVKSDPVKSEFNSDYTNKDVYLGIDVGAVSANLVLIDKHGNVVGKKYILTSGKPIETVKNGLKEMGEEVGASVDVLGVGVTGSGRYFIGHMVGADVIVNEITAQARGALHFDPSVDTLLEIGGQDSKYIRFDKGVVVDFEMNKVCAAGTGSFLEEQAGRLDIDIKGDFSKFAFMAHSPADLGTRCTVFMESDLIHHQQSGLEKENLLAGLAYGIVNNYLEKVVAHRKIGNNIYFQGGVAGNNAVVAAMEAILKKEVKVHEHHNVTGAIGAALMAITKNIKDTSFAGFNLENRKFSVNSFTCNKCANVCKIRKIYVNDEEKASIGSTCGRFDIDKEKSLNENIPDTFKLRKELLLGHERSLPENAPLIGIPRSIFFFEDFPFWKSYFNTLGYRIVLSDETSKELIYKGLKRTQSETCFPVKVSYGHIINLLEKNIKKIFYPSEADLPMVREDVPRACNCPYIQGLPYMLKVAFGDVEFLTPVMYFSGDFKNVEDELLKLGKSLGVEEPVVLEAISQAAMTQEAFRRELVAIGKSLLGRKELKRVILFGKGHHLFDEGQNMNIGKKLKKLGYTAIPYDFLPLHDVELHKSFENVVWKNSHDLIRASFLAREYGLPVIMLTNFGCGPDSFTMKYVDEILEGHPHTIVEIDDHTADAGLITRLEAFLDTLADIPEHSSLSKPDFKDYEVIIKRNSFSYNPLNPDPSIIKQLEGRTLYYHYVSDGMNSIIDAAFKSVGIDGKTMAVQDEHTEEYGRKYASGLECHPYIVTIGDIARFTMKEDFDPKKTAFFLYSYDGACRYSQYGLSYKIALKNMGFPEVLVLTPLISPRYDELTGMFGLNFTQTLWKGWISAAILESYLLSIRPYELQKGSADKAYEHALHMVADACSIFNYTDYFLDNKLIKALKNGIKELKAVPVDRSNLRPQIGILGEFFTVLSTWANNDLFRKLEGLGVEVKSNSLFGVANFISFFSERYYPSETKKKGKYIEHYYYKLRKFWLMEWAKKLEKELDKDAGIVKLIPTEKMIEKIGSVINPDLDPVSTTYLARIIDFAEQGVSGINYLIVLNCMLSNMTIPIFKNVLSKYNNLPFLSTPYDGFKQTNTLTRLEAFVHQVKLYKKRFGK